MGAWPSSLGQGMGRALATAVFSGVVPGRAQAAARRAEALHLDVADPGSVSAALAGTRRGTGRSTSCVAPQHPSAYQVYCLATIFVIASPACPERPWESKYGYTMV